jgi:SET domain-containing protein
MATAKQGNTRPFEIRRSRIQGKGVFATRKIRAGDRLIEYRGERISDEEADRRYPFDENERHHTFLFKLDDGSVIDAGVKGNAAKYINHSCDPNCEAVEEDEHIVIYALRDIRPGEELVYDYNYILDEPHNAANKKLYPCHCGAKKCRGTILARKR